MEWNPQSGIYYEVDPKPNMWGYVIDSELICPQYGKIVNYNGIFIIQTLLDVLQCSVNAKFYSMVRGDYDQYILIETHLKKCKDTVPGDTMVITYKNGEFQLDRVCCVEMNPDGTIWISCSITGWSAHPDQEYHVTEFITLGG